MFYCSTWSCSLSTTRHPTQHVNPIHLRLLLLKDVLDNLSLFRRGVEELPCLCLNHLVASFILDNQVEDQVPQISDIGQLN